MHQSMKVMCKNKELFMRESLLNIGQGLKVWMLQCLRVFRCEGLNV